MKGVLIAAVVALFCFVPRVPSNAIGKPSLVSMVQLLATPEKFDGKRIVVLGFLQIHQEADLLYLSKEDYDNVILGNTLWVDVTEEMGKRRETLGLKYVRLEGTFRAGNEMRNRVSVGGITDITSCELWSDPSDPREKKISREPVK